MAVTKLLLIVTLVTLLLIVTGCDDVKVPPGSVYVASGVTIPGNKTIIEEMNCDGNCTTIIEVENI